MKRFGLSGLLCLFALVQADVARADLGAGLLAHYSFTGNANDESGNGNHGTIHGPVPGADRFGRANSAYQFDGEDDFIEIVDTKAMDFGTGPFSVSVWIKTDALTTAGMGRDDILAKGDPTISGFSVSMQYGGPVFMNGGSLELSAGMEINNNEWHHIVGVREASHSVAIYVDGQMSNTGLNGDDVDVESNLIIGRHGIHQLESFFKGSMDDIRIYNRALSQNEVGKLYASFNVAGDVVPDGQLDLADAIAALVASSWVDLSMGTNLSADVNGDGKVGVPEAVYVLQWLAGLYNHPPILEAIGNKEVSENAQLQFTVSGSDYDNDDLVYAVLSLPEGATFESDTRVFSWMPSFAQGGIYQVTFVVSDRFHSDSETVTITVTEVPLFTSPDYFPLSVGNWWDYRDDASGKVERNQVSGTKTIHGTATRIYRYASGEREYYTSDSNGLKLYGVYLKSDEYTGDVIFDSPLLMAPNNVPVGSTHVSSTHAFVTIFVPGYGNVGVDLDMSSTTTLIGTEDVVTQNKTLTGCLKVSSELVTYTRQTGESFTDTTYYWFYKGVGVVKQSYDGVNGTISESFVDGIRQAY
jgi:hypothetical protein